MRISDWSSDVCSSDLDRYRMKAASWGDKARTSGKPDWTTICSPYPVWIIYTGCTQAEWMEFGLETPSENRRDSRYTIAPFSRVLSSMRRDDRPLDPCIYRHGPALARSRTGTITQRD